MQQNNDHSQCILLALCVCALGRGLPEKVLGLGQPGGGRGPPPPFGGGWGSPPPTAPQTVEHPSGSHIGWRPPPWESLTTHAEKGAGTKTTLYVCEEEEEEVEEKVEVCGGSGGWEGEGQAPPPPHD